MRDTSRFDALIAALTQAGITRVQNVRFRTTELRKYRDQARDMAVLAAREKAVAMAGKLDQKIGKAYAIEEDEPQIITPLLRLTPGVFSANSTAEMGSSSSEVSESSFMPGQISIQARVKVQFELL
jgi:uncharacterized protein YggE